MEFKLVRVTPAMAQELLDKVPSNQRNPKLHKISLYTQDMEAGRWKLTHQPIGIGPNGELQDGQNRMAAVIRYGKPVMFWFAYGVNGDTLLGIDIGAGRTVRDMAHFLDLPCRGNAHPSVVRCMADGLMTSRVYSHQQILAWIKEHQKTLDWCFEVMPKNMKGVTLSAVRAVVCRAYEKRATNRERLAEFCQVLISGLPSHPKKDKAVILLRNWLIKHMTQGVRGSQGIRPKNNFIYAMTEAALVAFLNGEDIDRLEPVTKEQF